MDDKRNGNNSFLVVEVLLWGLVVIALVFACSGCQRLKQPKATHPKTPAIRTIYENSFVRGVHVVTVDGQQYVVISQGLSGDVAIFPHNPEPLPLEDGI